MNIYAFPSRTRTNIWAGIGRGLWAVSHSEFPSTNKGRATKAAKMPVHVPLSGKTMEFDGAGKCTAGC